jgi:hypothetical protein
MAQGERPLRRAARQTPGVQMVHCGNNGPRAGHGHVRRGHRNIGIACRLSGLIVVDEDVPGDFTRYAETIGQWIPATFTVRTGKGSHFYFRQPAGVTLTNNEGALRSYGNKHPRGRRLVVGPGSIHAKRYRVCPDRRASADLGLPVMAGRCTHR